jgi:membrane-associated phospholipid phosphatase
MLKEMGLNSFPSGHALATAFMGIEFLFRNTKMNQFGMLFLVMLFTQELLGCIMTDIS